MTQINFTQSCLTEARALQGVARARLSGRGREGEERAGHPGPFGGASSESPPPQQAGRNRKRPSACSRCPAGWKEAGVLEWLPAATAVAGGPGFLLQPPDLWRPPFPGDSHWPSAGLFAICLAFFVHGPESATRCWWAGVGRQLDQEVPAFQGEESLWPHPRLPAYLHPGASFVAGAGQSLGKE